MKKKLGFFIFILLTLQGCHFSPTQEYWGNISQKGKKAIKFTELLCDTIFLEDIHCSQNGHLSYDKSSFIYLDKTFCFAFIFDEGGKFQERHLGSGKGPNEIIFGTNYLPFNDSHFVYGNLRNYYVINDQWSAIKKQVIRWEGKSSRSEVYNNPKPEMIAIYEPINYRNAPTIYKENFLLLPVNTEHWKYNGFKHLEYYRDSRIFALLNIESGEVESIYGRRSKEYLEYKFLPNFDFFHFDCFKNEIILNYDIDSSLYVLDEKFNAKMKFGFAGRDMNTRYRETKGYDDAEDNFFADRKEFGHYDYVKFIQETGMIFRTYSKGGKSSNGLQVYNQEFNLIADVDVPVGFRVLGQRNNTYYAEYDEGLQKQPMIILKFKL